MNNEIRSLNSTMPVAERVTRERRNEAANESGANVKQTADTGRLAQAKAENTVATANDKKKAESSAPPDRTAVEEAAKELASRAEKMGRDLRFEVDDDSGMTVVKVIDRLTEEVVRQIPSEEAVERASSQSDDALNLIDAKA